MNTKIVMTLSAVMMGAGGVLFTFMPDVVVGFFKIHVHPITLLLMQILGAFYFAFAMLNWMTKASRIGGIYNRPITVANFTHFFIVALALLKLLVSNSGLPVTCWILGVVYVGFGLAFGVMLFRHPIAEKI
jgi:hypothetical protein